MFRSCIFFFFNDTATTEIYTLSLHDALPICLIVHCVLFIFLLFVACSLAFICFCSYWFASLHPTHHQNDKGRGGARSEEHTSELQSRQYLVCRLLLEKKKKIRSPALATHISQ